MSIYVYIICIYFCIIYIQYQSFWGRQGHPGRNSVAGYTTLAETRRRKRWLDSTLLAKDSPQLQSTQSNSPLALDASVTRAAQAMQIKAATLVSTMRIQPVRLAGRASFHSGHLQQTRKSTMETRTPVTELKHAEAVFAFYVAIPGQIARCIPLLFRVLFLSPWWVDWCWLASFLLLDIWDAFGLPFHG